MGLAGWCRIFVKEYAKIAGPLTELTRKEEPFLWTERRQQSFDKLKEILSSFPVLKLPDFSQPFEVVVDACGQGIGGILKQEGHPVAYKSRQLRIHEKNYPTHDLELLAVVYALKRWRHYLLGRLFQLVTDHKSLKWIFTQPDLNMRQRRWVEFLQEFEFEIKFRPGKENAAADALSRRIISMAITILQSNLPEEIQQGIKEDEFFGPFLIRLQEGEVSKQLEGYSVEDGQLLYLKRLCVPAKVKFKILKEAHEGPLASHPGYHKMYENLKKSFFWPKMKKDALEFAKQCLVCQKIKAERVKLPGLLRPLDIPEMKWECISMDFVTGLPSVSGGYDSIFVVVDKLTKVAHLIPVKKTFSASDVAKVFVKEVVRLHGFPRRIISDRDSKFTSKFWKALFDSVETELSMSTAFHPESDGQTERVNQVIEDMLRAYCNRQPSSWVKYLPLVEFAYNSSHHRSLGMSPFKALYGQECLTPLKLSDPLNSVPAAKEMLEDMDLQLKIIRGNLKAASDRQKSYADLKRSVREFAAGEMVFLRVKPKRSSLRLGKYKKLAFRYCGPYQIIKRIGEQAYELALSPHLKIHNVFHVSLLKKYVSDPQHVLEDDHVNFVSQDEVIAEPDVILQSREKSLRNRTLREVLVQWKGYPADEASWEDWDLLVKKFPFLSS